MSSLSENESFVGSDNEEALVNKRTTKKDEKKTTNGKGKKKIKTER